MLSRSEAHRLDLREGHPEVAEPSDLQQPHEVTGAVLLVPVGRPRLAARADRTGGSAEPCSPSFRRGPPASLVLQAINGLRVWSVLRRKLRQRPSSAFKTLCRNGVKA